MNENIKTYFLGNIHGENKGAGFAGAVWDPAGLSPTVTTCQEGGRQPHILINKREDNSMDTIQIKQATKKGYIELEKGGLFDGSYPTSSTRRGRVQEGGSISPTITAQNNEIYRAESKYRIRKLTPKECFRLMGVTDEDADKMLSVNSSSQCYKQAGNSIVVDVMIAMFAKLF